MSSACSRWATWVFQDMPSAPPGRSSASQPRQRRAPAAPAGRGRCRPRRRSCRAPRRTAGRRRSRRPSCPCSRPSSCGGVGLEDGQLLHGAGLVVVLAAAMRDLEAAAEPLALAAHRRRVGGVLEPLALEPGLQEQLVRLDVLAVDLDADGVLAVHQGLVERGAPAAERVEHGELAGRASARPRRRRAA